MAYNLPDRTDLLLEVISWVLRMSDVEVPDNVVALWAPVATSSALLLADLLLPADVELSVVHLNMDASTSGKAMSEKVGCRCRRWIPGSDWIASSLLRSSLVVNVWAVNLVTLMGRMMNRVYMFMCINVLILLLYLLGIHCQDPDNVRFG